MTGTATIHALPSAEIFTITDAKDMLTGASDYWSSHCIECTACREAPGGTCPEHDEDDRLAFLAGKLSTALEHAGEDVLAGLLGLGRSNVLGINSAAVSGEGEK
jgi:hypothetical protein